MGLGYPETFLVVHCPKKGRLRHVASLQGYQEIFMAFEFEQYLPVIDFRCNGGIELHLWVALVSWDREHPASLVPTPMTPPRFSTPPQPLPWLRTEYQHHLTRED